MYVIIILVEIERVWLDRTRENTVFATSHVFATIYSIDLKHYFLNFFNSLHDFTIDFGRIPFDCVHLAVKLVDIPRGLKYIDHWKSFAMSG